MDRCMALGNAKLIQGTAAIRISPTRMMVRYGKNLTLDSSTVVSSTEQVAK
jgi:hypothetical protein